MSLLNVSCHNIILFIHMSVKLIYHEDTAISKIKSEYDQEIPQSQTADKATQQS